MHVQATLLFLLAAAMAPVRGAEPSPRDQACQQATRAYQDAPADAQAERRFRQACYPVHKRAPVLQAPIAVDGTLRPPTPVPPPAVAPAARPTRGPTVLTLCDGGGCWDNQGTRYDGTGTILMGPGGMPCLRSGDRIECR